MKKRVTGCVVGICLLMLLQTGVCASETPQEAASEQDSREITYTVIKEKEKIKMLPGEYRYVASSISYDAQVESSDTKILQAANSGQIYARRPGTVKVTVTEGTTKRVYTVQIAGEVDLIIFAGQSNMCGSGGNRFQAPQPESGTAYEFDVATGSKSCIAMKEPFGQGTNRKTGFDDNKTYSTSGTLVSAFSISYYKQTKTPVVGVPAAWGGTSTNSWLKRGLVKETQQRVKLAKKCLKKNKVKIRHIYMVWYQGETDAEQGRSAEQYIANMKKIYNRMKTVGVEQMMVIQIGRDMHAPEIGYTIMGAQTKLCKTDKHFTMVSTKPKMLYDVHGSYYYDSIHINQNGLNKIGTEAGKNAGRYAKKHKKK